MVFLRFPWEKQILCENLADTAMDSSRIRDHIIAYLGSHDFRLYHNGKELLDGEEIFQDATVYVTFSLPGGKGGFGSMLRAIGAQIEKTTNREACRDLSGRRLRDINEEQRLKKWIAKEAEREAEKIQRRKARIERLKTKPKHNFVDFDYEKEISQLPERIDDALTAGMQKVSKRPVEEGESSKAHPKKKCIWLDEDISASSGSDSESCEKNISPGCSRSSDENQKNLPRTLSSEMSESEPSNSCSSFETKTSNFYERQVAEEQISSTIPSERNSLSTSTSATEEQVSSNVCPEEQSSSSVLESNDNKDITDNDTSPPVENRPHSVHQQETETVKESETSTSKDQEEDSPLDLLTFKSVAELESLGLDRLKSALMVRGLKCGGNLSDRAQRLWRVRGLQPDEYPASLLAKKKK